MLIYNSQFIMHNYDYCVNSQFTIHNYDYHDY